MRDLTHTQFIAALSRHGCTYSNTIWPVVHFACGNRSTHFPIDEEGNRRTILSRALREADNHTPKPCRGCYEDAFKLRESVNKQRLAQGKELLPEPRPFEELVAA